MAKIRKKAARIKREKNKVVAKQKIQNVQKHAIWCFEEYIKKIDENDTKISVQVERRKSVEIKYHFCFMQIQEISTGY